jgi:alpha-beta hydrolase superfamily lysophospholipase
MLTEATFNGVDGAELFYRVIEPLMATKAKVILVHGHGDHSGGLQSISTKLIKNGYFVYAFDLRGHGKSSGKRGFIRSWDEYRGDLHEFRKLVALEQPELPLYIVGHSMGGLITLDYILDNSTGISGIAAIAPAISYEVTAFERLGVTLMSKIKPDYSIDKNKDYQFLAENPSLRAKFYSDRLRHNTITPDLGHGLIQAISRVRNNAKSIKLPFLLQYGLEDKITPPTRLRHFFNQVASEEKRVVEYASARHRPFNEVGREKFLGELVGWLDQQISGNQEVLYRKVGNRL